ncbi:hypothetical protein [Streptomyces specialis]|uniref:hypothetical protein n=1 Tax=Streptomyces specialis TaxID=498367 RepID=UPI00073EA90F|nr:hypothetical protein [Streptomyces specialis]
MSKTPVADPTGDDGPAADPSGSEGDAGLSPAGETADSAAPDADLATTGGDGDGLTALAATAAILLAAGAATLGVPRRRNARSRTTA